MWLCVNVIIIWCSFCFFSSFGLSISVGCFFFSFFFDCNHHHRLSTNHMINSMFTFKFITKTKQQQQQQRLINQWSSFLLVSHLLFLKMTRFYMMWIEEKSKNQITISRIHSDRFMNVAFLLFLSYGDNKKYKIIEHPKTTSKTESPNKRIRKKKQRKFRFLMTPNWIVNTIDEWKSENRIYKWFQIVATTMNQIPDKRRGRDSFIIFLFGLVKNIQSEKENKHSVLND